MANQNDKLIGEPQSDSKESQHDPTIKRPLDPRRVLQILECKRKIMHFVELMLDDDITIDTLKSGEELICKADYDSIVQERFILKICGYPLCSNKLVKEWKQRFHVSMRDKKIYDVEVRKLFCSVTCMYRSRKYRDDFIQDQPIWTRLDYLRLGPEGVEFKHSKGHSKQTDT